jgi:hypothetical protein
MNPSAMPASRAKTMIASKGFSQEGNNAMVPPLP